MAPPSGHAAYKKQNGTIAISNDRKSVSWTPLQPPDASPLVVISASNVTNLQQTPESNPKVMLKIFAQEPGQPEPVTHVFTFTSPSAARPEANAIKDALASVIQAQKAAQNAAAGDTPSGGASAAMTIANAISGGSRSGNLWEDDERLKSDVRLQQSLMSEDPALQRTFLEARSLKPESITNTQFTAQFWSSRVHLLRAHALGKSQSRGAYNVFSALQKTDGGSRMKLSAEHIHMIFAQYPLTRRVYDELVPKQLNEHDFWSRFFQSRLYKTLRGERFDDRTEARDGILDPYCFAPELTGLRPTVSEMHMPKILDMEGNEENHSQRKGNRPDVELNPKALEKSKIIRTLNSLSEKLMSHVRPSDVDPSAPIGMDEATYENLRLRDLAGDPEQNRMILKIQDQSRFVSERDVAVDTAGDALPEVDPAQALQDVRADLAQKFPHPGAGVIAIDVEDSEDDDDDDTKAPSASDLATQHIMSLIRQNRAQTEEIPASSGLSVPIYERLLLTHATTIEFLHQFWSAFLSGDSGRVGEVTSLVESLGRAVDRINSVAEDAEKERQVIVKKAEQNAREVKQRTGRTHRIDYAAIEGGEAVVRQLLDPILNALKNAGDQYQKALQQQLADGDG